MPRDKESGFSLFEVILAILLFTIGFVAVARVFSTGLFAESDTEKVLVATNLAEERIEQFRNLNYSGIVSEAKAAISGFTNFGREVIVSEPQTSLKQIEVRVYYPSKPGENSISLVTYVSDI